MHNRFPILESNEAIGTSLETIGGEIILHNINFSPVINIEIENLGAVALNAFSIELKDHENGEWYTFLSGANFTSTTILSLLAVNTTPVTLASGAKSHVIFRPWSAYACRFRTSVASGSGSVTIRGAGRGA